MDNTGGGDGGGVDPGSCVRPGEPPGPSTDSEGLDGTARPALARPTADAW
jgi:hypothetical protein